jgi:hypothetical protein
MSIALNRRKWLETQVEVFLRVVIAVHRVRHLVVLEVGAALGKA